MNQNDAIQFLQMRKCHLNIHYLGRCSSLFERPKQNYFSKPLFAVICNKAFHASTCWIIAIGDTALERNLGKSLIPGNLKNCASLSWHLPESESPSAWDSALEGHHQVAQEHGQGWLARSRIFLICSPNFFQCLTATASSRVSPTSTKPAIRLYTGFCYQHFCQQNFIFAANDSDHTRIHPRILVIATGWAEHGILGGVLLGRVATLTAKAVITAHSGNCTTRLACSNCGLLPNLYQLSDQHQLITFHTVHLLSDHGRWSRHFPTGSGRAAVFLPAATENADPPVIAAVLKIYAFECMLMTIPWLKKSHTEGCIGTN